MTEAEALDRLAKLAGVEDGWWDFFGVWRPVSIATKRAFLSAMGFEVGGESTIKASLEELESRPWRRWVEPVTMIEEHQPAAEIVVTIPAARDKETLQWTLEEELGAVHTGRFQVDTLRWIEETWLHGTFIKRWRLALPELPPLGYHKFRLSAADGTAFDSKVIVAPAAAYLPPVVDDGARAWGVATQIYALRGPGDWGVGTYKALERLAAGASKLGASTIGVNPLHALFPAQPDRFSPYSPSSRRFLNVTYIDIEAIPEFKNNRTVARLVASPAVQSELTRLREAVLVDYPGYARVTRPVLEELYRSFRKSHLDPGDERGQAFRQFQKLGGHAAELFCTFEALHERFLAEGNGYWRHWPEDFRHPHSKAVVKFGKDQRQRIEFFWWLQFIADEQLGAANAAVQGNGGIGLYRDLGVGISGDGAEAWLEQDNLANGMSVGAPPDPLALKGQDWGLVPFNPIAMREAAYAPFIGVMAANMRHAGALRLDHAMALQRLYWVPPGMAADQGAYIRYPVDDLFHLVALESRRNHCLVIGEDLGTVPDGFRERMARMNIFAYRVMVFEKDSRNEVRPAEEFDELALAVFATHDLPSLRGWWNGADINLREALDLYPRPDVAGEERKARAADRHKMVAALVREGLLPEKFKPEPPLDPRRTLTLSEAAHQYLARSRSRLTMVQIEDVLGLESQMNLPGTTDQHPNWRMRFPFDVDKFVKDPQVKKQAVMLNKVRGRG